MSVSKTVNKGWVKLSLPKKTSENNQTKKPSFYCVTDPIGKKYTELRSTVENGQSSQSFSGNCPNMGEFFFFLKELSLIFWKYMYRILWLL